jgi:hypothetical protein
MYKKKSAFHCDIRYIGDSPHIEMLTNFFHPLTERSNLKTKIKGKGDGWWGWNGNWFADFGEMSCQCE